MGAPERVSGVGSAEMPKTTAERDNVQVVANVTSAGLAERGGEQDTAVEPTLRVRHEAVDFEEGAAVRVVKVVAAHVGHEIARDLRSETSARQAVGCGHDQLTCGDCDSAGGNAMSSTACHGVQPCSHCQCQCHHQRWTF